MTDTETYIVHFTQLIELAVARGGGSTCMVCGVDFIMEASPLPPSLPVSDIEMNKFQYIPDSKKRESVEHYFIGYIYMYIF